MRIPCFNTISIQMVVLILKSFFIFMVTRDLHEIMLLVTDAIFILDFSSREFVWSISYVTLASSSTLLDPVTELNYFKWGAEFWLYRWQILSRLEDGDQTRVVKKIQKKTKELYIK